MPDLYEITKRYGLAACCIVGPLLFGLGGDYYATQRLVAVPDPTIALRYLPSTPPGYCGSASEIRGHLAASFTAAGVSPAAPTQRPSAQAVAPPCPDANDKIASPPYSEADDPNNVLKFWTIGQQYRGRITYAVASAFLFLIAGVVLIFALSIVAPKLKWLGTIAALIVFAVIAVYCAQNSYRPAGRTLIVEKLLGSADGFFPYVRSLRFRQDGRGIERLLHYAVSLSPSLNFLEADKDDTGTTVGSLVQFNTVISFLPIGMLLLSLFVLSIRLEKDLSIAVLQRRLTLLRVALALGSTFLVVGVLAQKILMEWPLSLILESQTVGLRQLASALTLQVGAQGTIALLAAFGPAIAAWYLDAAALRHKSVDVLPSHPRDSADAQAGNAIVVAPLAFAPLSAIASFFAVLAPLLASPVADAIKSLLLIFTKGSP